jgi:hypothetical protein
MIGQFDYLIYEEQDTVVPIATSNAPINGPNSNPTSAAGTTNNMPNTNPNPNPTGATSAANTTPNTSISTTGMSNIIIASNNTVTSYISKMSSPTSTVDNVNIILSTNADSSPTAGSTS